MHGLDGLAVAHIHVNAAGQAGVETAHGAHDVDTLEVVRPVLFEDRCALDRVLVGPRCTEDVARSSVPRGWRIGMIVGDLAAADDEVVRENTAHRLVEAAADGFVGYLEVRPCLSAAGL